MCNPVHKLTFVMTAMCIFLHVHVLKVEQRRNPASATQSCVFLGFLGREETNALMPDRRMNSESTEEMCKRYI